MGLRLKGMSLSERRPRALVEERGQEAGHGRQLIQSALLSSLLLWTTAAQTGRCLHGVFWAWIVTKRRDKGTQQLLQRTIVSCPAEVKVL